MELDPDLGAGLTVDELAEARRQVVLPTVGLEQGPWGIEQLQAARGVRGEVRGFMVIDGAVTIEAVVAGRPCARLITASELVLLDGRPEDSIPTRWGWGAVAPATIAVLDQRLLVIACRWPGLMGEVLKRAAQQVGHALLQQAICQLPRVEDRLLALLWSIGDRHGIVRPDGVWVSLPITHETLARMIGARRPTVSLGLTELTERGMLRATDGGWLLDPASSDRFQSSRIESTERAK